MRFRMPLLKSMYICDTCGFRVRWTRLPLRKRCTNTSIQDKDGNLACPGSYVKDVS